MPTFQMIDGEIVEVGPEVEERKLAAAAYQAEVNIALTLIKNHMQGGYPDEAQKVLENFCASHPLYYVA